MTFEDWLPFDEFDNVQWIRRPWIEMCLKKCASESQEAKKERKRGNKRRVTDLGQRASKPA